MRKEEIGTGKLVGIAVQYPVQIIFIVEGAVQRPGAIRQFDLFQQGGGVHFSGVFCTFQRDRTFIHLFLADTKQILRDGIKKVVGDHEQRLSQAVLGNGAPGLLQYDFLTIDGVKIGHIQVSSLEIDLKLRVRLEERQILLNEVT